MRGIYLYRPLNRDRHPATAALKAPAYLATWLEAFPDSQPTNCDFEDWAENAVLLHEARQREIDLQILPSAQMLWISSTAFETPRSEPGAPVGAMFGHWSGADFINGLPVPISLVGQDAHAAGAASEYAASPVFQRHAGRRTIYVDATADHLEHVLAEILGNRTETDVFLKSVKKGFSDIVHITAGSSLSRQVFDQLDGLDLDFMHYEGNRRMLLAQDVIHCGYEYRLFVVDGKLVTGAGCVEHHTPLDNLEVFDPQMEPRRNRSSVDTYADVRDQHLAFAEKFVEEFAAEHGRHLDYCLDVALDDQGRTFVIELNPPLNCGRYASDVGAWMDAVIARTEAAA
ncbi:ATP-grasp domain-containing protein [Sphingomonas sp. 3-13AW]|uniref:ATP-grasp domain-containing protein n=1 Tax=Sphingomonas sp. 3-13AW TaxID=3050450 RepID=UPI003BB72144